MKKVSAGLYVSLLKESLAFAIHALRVNKLRTFLSLLGVTIGIFAIISVFTMVDSLEKNVRGSIESLGDNVIFVQKWPWTFVSEYPWWKYMNRPVPQLDELDFVTRKSKLAEAACFMVGRMADAEYKSNAFERIEVVAISHDYYRVKELQLLAGRYFSIPESKSGKAYCIIGYDIAAVLFSGTNPIGKKIKVAKRKMTVIGVLDREGESFLGNTADQQVFVPVNYAKTFMDIRSEKLNPFLMVKAKPEVSNFQLMEELTGIMRAVRRLKPKADDNFALNQTSMLTNTFGQLFNIMNMAGTIIGMFSILVGGFGIANIMFVSVKERINIIGIQKALGAKNSFILFQFLSEAVILCVFGGLIGIGLIFIITTVVQYAFDFNIYLSLNNVALGIGISVGIGLISGIWPAQSAANLDPVDAIRAK